MGATKIRIGLGNQNLRAGPEYYKFKMCVKTQVWQTFRKVGLFDATNTTIALNELNALDGLRHKVGDEIVRVKNQGLEHLSWGDWSGELLDKCG